VSGGDTIEYRGLKEDVCRTNDSEVWIQELFAKFAEQRCRFV
jgi:hypothetical protein